MSDITKEKCIQILESLMEKSQLAGHIAIGDSTSVILLLQTLAWHVNQSKEKKEAPTKLTEVDAFQTLLNLAIESNVKGRAYTLTDASNLLSVINFIKKTFSTKETESQSDQDQKV